MPENKKLISLLILLGVGVIVFFVYATTAIRDAASRKNPEIGRFALVANGNGAMFKIDTLTGESWIIARRDESFRWQEISH